MRLDKTESPIFGLLCVCVGGGGRGEGLFPKGNRLGFCFT